MTQDAIAEFATWTEPETSFQVHYSLPVFHEIEVAVSDGYRRIPHGGIEVGGLLLGHRLAAGIRIEAFRPIECEHALGPSFKLSDTDVAKLRQQIAGVSGDPETAGLQTLGWFIAHTRGALQPTEAEARQFDELFPESGMMTMLVKPEKFKPTLFTFFVRGAAGSLEVDGAARAIILPLPGRAARSAEPQPLAAILPVDAPPVVLEREAEPVPVPLNSTTAMVEKVETPAVKPLPIELLSPEPKFEPLAPSASRVRDTEGESKHRGTLIAIVLAAALLGGVAGYWIYLQMTPAIIQLTIEPQPKGVIVSWPPEQTSSTSHAFIRVNDGSEVELPPDSKSEGRWEVHAVPDNLKIELIARHTLHDSRGVVRYIEPNTLINILPRNGPR